MMPNPTERSRRIKLVSKKDMAFYKLALKISEESLCDDRHGAVIVKSGRVLALGTNMRSNGHAYSTLFFRTHMHAEQRAIGKCRAKCEGSTIYSARDYPSNPISLPCEMCMQLIIWAGIKKIIYHDGKEVRSIKL